MKFPSLKLIPRGPKEQQKQQLSEEPSREGGKESTIMAAEAPSLSGTLVSQQGGFWMTDETVFFTDDPGSAFGRWEQAHFQVDEHHYFGLEHYVMASLARTFHDDGGTLRAVLNENNPAELQQLAAPIVAQHRPAIDAWEQERIRCYLRGYYAIFTQAPDRCDQLLATGDKILALTITNDKKWGIGMEAGHSDAEHQRLWTGQNLLGKILMYVRNKIRWEEPELARRPEVQRVMAELAQEHHLHLHAPIPQSMWPTELAITGRSLGELDMQSSLISVPSNEVPRPIASRDSASKEQT